MSLPLGSHPSTPHPAPAVGAGGRVDELDGLRGVLALWVAVTHILCMCGLAGDTRQLRLPHFAEELWLDFIFAAPAVECFIILSGFAISFLLARKPQPYGRFLAARACRLYPAYLVCMVAALGALSITPFVLETPVWRDAQYFGWVREHHENTIQHLGLHLFWHATMLHGLPTREILPDSASAILGPGWSITLEWQFYILAPLLLGMLRRPAGIVAVGLIAWLGIHFQDPWANPHVSFLPPQLPLFLVGMASYRIYSGLGGHLIRRHDHLALLLAAGFVTVLLVNWHRTALTIWLIVFASLFAGPSGWSGILRSLLLHRWTQVIGRASYSLYLIHFPMIIGGLYMLLRVHPQISSVHAAALLLTCLLPLIIVAAVLSHRFVELPGMNLGRRFSRPA